MKNTKHCILVSLLTLLFFLSYNNNVKAQSRQVPNLLHFDHANYHFGFLLGINQMLYTIKTTDDFKTIMYYNVNGNQDFPDVNCDSAYVYGIESTPSFGFVIGIIGNLKMGKYFDLRFTPSLTFGERTLHYDLYKFTTGEAPDHEKVSKNIQSTFVDFPLVVRYKGSRIHNVRPFVFAGGKYALDLASNAKKKVNNISGVFLNQNDFYALGGFGFDFYTAYFKFGIELSMSYGFLDIIKRNEMAYTKSITELNSKVFHLSFTFE